MKRVLTLVLLFLILSIFSCVTPEQALEKRWYKTALRLSAQKIKNGKDVEKNKRILQIAADHVVAEELKGKKDLVNSPKVKDWIKVQDSYYRVLEDIGKANIVSDGAVLHAYDEMCSIKKDLDFKIVEYYYIRGEKNLQKFYNDGQKKDARSAYYEFARSKKHGANLYYQDIEDLIKESHLKGIVYYVGDASTIGYSFFLKPLPSDADFEPDCDIDIEYGSFNFSEVISESAKVYTKELVVGREEEKDTSGNVTYRDVIEEIEATVTTVEIEVTVSTWTNVYSTDITGQCTVSSESFKSEVSDKYEEIHISGDNRAVPTGISEEKGAPAFFESGLIRDLKSKVQSDLNWLF